MSRQEFASYFSSLHLDRSYPGIESVGYVEFWPKEAATRRVGELQHLEITTAVPNQDKAIDLAPVLYVHTRSADHALMIGKNLWSSQETQYALKRAAATQRISFVSTLSLNPPVGHALRHCLFILPLNKIATGLNPNWFHSEPLKGWMVLDADLAQMAEIVWRQSSINMSAAMGVAVREAKEGSHDGPLLFQVKSVSGLDEPRFTKRMDFALFDAHWDMNFSSPITAWQDYALVIEKRIVLAVCILLSILCAVIAALLVRFYRVVDDNLNATRQSNRTLVEQGSLLAAIYNSSSTAIFLINKTGHIQHATDRLAEILSYPNGSAMIGLTLDQLIVDDHQRLEILANISEIYTLKSEGFLVETQLLNPHQKVCWGRLSARPFWSADQEVSGLVCSLEDITDERAAAEKLLLSDSVFKASPLGIMVTDAKTNIVTVNPGFCQLTGYLEQEVKGYTPEMLQPTGDAEAFYQNVWQTLGSEDSWEGDLVSRRKDGSLFVCHLQMRKIRRSDGAVSHFLGLFQDVTERQQAEEKIRYLAMHDSLTGLPNRAAFLERAEYTRALVSRRQGRFACIFIDLDKFKPINDQHGHEAGDMMLKSVAQQLQQSLRIGDVACRLGGDEFVVLISELQVNDDLFALSNRLLVSIEKPVRFGDVMLSVSASLGVAIYPDHGQSVSEIIQSADTAMYESKANGRACVSVARR